MTEEKYPPAERRDVTDTIHGTQVRDPYRWLEDADSPQATQWQQAQDELYTSQAASLPGRDRLASRLTELLASGEAGTPCWRGDRQFYTRREPGQDHPVLYTSVPGEDERILIDPVEIDPAGTTTLDRWQPDHEGRLLAYQLSEGGQEQSVLRVLDVATGQHADGPIDRCRYSEVAWLPGGSGFYYSRRLAPDAVPDGEAQYHQRVYFHQVGTSPDSDALIFGAGLDKTNFYAVAVSRDGRWLIISATAGTAPRNDVYLADLTGADPAEPDLMVLQQAVDATTWPTPGRDGRLYLHTDRDAPRGRIMVADPASPDFPAYPSWTELIAEDPEAVLQGFAILDGPELSQPVLLAARTRHAIGEIAVHALATGAPAGSVTLPGLGSVGGLSTRPEGGHEAWFGYSDYSAPGQVLHYDATTGATSVWQRAPGAVEVPAVRAEQVAYQSKDGTTVRMVVLSAAAGGGTGATGGGERPAQPRPAILYGYGGFNISLTPAFSAAILTWVEAGGVYAIAGLRGGSEEGEQWHRAGMREHKQNVFDDFHAAAEKLIADGWTTAGQLAVMGGSNGGLLVGASVTQRPGLSAAAVCSAPLLDMIRYEQSGLGQLWTDEYGTVADEREFGWLQAYSPYHHVTDGVRYPAILFTVFDGDSRVDPLHGRKMCAALQHATAAPLSERPVLIRREASVGHGTRAISRTVGLSCETLAFLAAHTGLALG
jgi:prolyl oligopeptidase